MYRETIARKWRNKLNNKIYYEYGNVYLLVFDGSGPILPMSELKDNADMWERVVDHSLEKFNFKLKSRIHFKIVFEWDDNTDTRNHLECDDLEEASKIISLLNG